MAIPEKAAKPTALSDWNDSQDWEEGDGTEVWPHRCRAGSRVNDVVDTVKK